MKPARIRRSRAKGWRMPEGAVYVGRGSPWGNPFVVGEHGTRARCVELYRLLLGGYYCLTTGPEIDAQRKVVRHVQRHLARLRGKPLACWCALDGGACHADVLLELANQERQP